MKSTENDPDSRTLADAAYALLREQILSCELAPGASISERQLSSTLGYGATPVREALARLRYEGLVVALPRVGYQVTPLTVQGVSDIFQVWEFLAPSITELGIARLTPTGAERIEALYEQSKERMSSPATDLDEWRMLSGEIFNVLLESTNNARLIQMFRHLQADLRRLFVILLEHPDARRLVGLHQEPAYTVHPDTPPVVAAERMRAYVVEIRRAVMEVITTFPSVAAANVSSPRV